MAGYGRIHAGYMVWAIVFCRLCFACGWRDVVYEYLPRGNRFDSDEEWTDVRCDERDRERESERASKQTSRAGSRREWQAHEIKVAGTLCVIIYMYVDRSTCSPTCRSTVDLVESLGEGFVLKKRILGHHIHVLPVRVESVHVYM